MWTLFRVENEHCANVAHFKASRDVPLPYDLPDTSEEDFERTQPRPESEAVGGDSSTPVPSTELPPRRAGTWNGAGSSLEAQRSHDSSLRRRPVRTLTSIVADAHTQDFEKKRKPVQGESDNLLGKSKSRDEREEEGGSSDDEDEEDLSDELDILDAEELLRDRRRLGDDENPGGS